MRKALSAPFFAALLTASTEIPPAWGEDTVVLPPSILMAASTGYWEDNATPLAGTTVSTQTAATPASAPQAAPRHGYYKLYAVRQPDRTSKVYLQQILSADDGPQVLSTTELKDVTALKAFVTDIQPENSGGIIHEPGLFATLFIKRDIDGDAEAWNVSRDDLGEISVEKVPAD